jgi:hypothetical protein
MDRQNPPLHNPDVIKSMLLNKSSWLHGWMIWVKQVDLVRGWSFGYPQ